MNIYSVFYDFFYDDNVEGFLLIIKFNDDGGRLYYYEHSIYNGI